MKNLFGQINGWLDSLPQRENRMVKIGLATSVALFFFFVFFVSISTLAVQKKHLKADRKLLTDIQALESVYYEAKAQQRMEERKYALNTVSLFSLMQAIADRLELSLKDLNELRTPIPDSNLVEYRVVVNLNSLSIDKLSAFIQAVEERKPVGLVKITGLQIKTRFDSPDLLDATMTISTWKVG